ncbi:MAG: Mu-like prophage major head subunit gpT family protein [Holophagales bacterium]|jgi:phage major head subunit gpT-like protein|nr:Mu-like prophage major head subunit gpT family protein [Holophagales bacterium]
MIINQSALSNLFIGYKASFQNAFEGVKPMWTEIATPITSSTRSEKYAWLGQWPMLREWIGDRQVRNLETHDYSIKNRNFEVTVSVERNDIEDDQYGIYSPMMAEMGRAAATHPDELVFGLLRNGFSEKCFDGQPFFDADHPVGETTVSNMQSGTDKPWFLLSTTRSLKPLIYQIRKDYKFVHLIKEEDPNVFFKNQYIYGVDGRSNVGFGFWQMAFGSKAELNKENFVAARESMSKLRSPEGRPLGLRPNLLLVGPGNEQQAVELIKAERNAAGATNTLLNAVDIVVSPYLD